MNEWLMTHNGFVHLCKPGGEQERMTMCCRSMTVYPDKIEPWMLRCSKCELVEKRMKS